MSLILVIFGPPAVGKGTQASLLSAHFSVPHLSTGAMLRDAVAANSRLGKRIKSIMAKGSLVPDRLIIKIVSQRVGEADCHDGYILDGVPRTVRQAKFLDRILRNTRKKITAVIVLLADEVELRKRVTKRADEARNRGEPVRSDDNLEVFERRLDAYRRETEPVLQYYARHKNLVRVDAMLSAEKVSATIIEKVTEISLHRPWYVRWFPFWFN